jgi:hypothetical protein
LGECLDWFVSRDQNKVPAPSATDFPSVRAIPSERRSVSVLVKSWVSWLIRGRAADGSRVTGRM